MATATYDKIATQNGTGSSGIITFSSIPSTYTDLKLIASIVTTGGGGSNINNTFNGDTATNYSNAWFYGNGSTAASAANTSQANFQSSYFNGDSLSSTIPTLIIYDIFSYANTGVYKTVLIQSSGDKNGSGGSGAGVSLWRSTAAITSITLTQTSLNYTTSSVFTLYGIKAA